MPDVVIAESSPAPVAPAPPAAETPSAPLHTEPVAEPEVTAPDLGSLTDAEYRKWRETGDLPAMKPQKAESAPATESTAPKGETAPASEPGPKSEEPAKPKGAEARKAQLNAEIQDLLRQRREAREALDRERRQPATPAAEPAPATSEDREPIFKEYLDKAETYEEAQQKFQRDHSKWAYRTLRAEEQAAEQQRQIAEQREAFTKRVERDSAEIEDFDTVTARAVDMRLTPAMLGAIYESDIPGKLMYELAKNPADFQRIAALTPAKAIRELTKIEDRLLTPPQPKNGTPAPPATKPASTPPPPPPTELAGRNTPAEDEAEAALQAKDFPRYQKVMNARDLEQLRRR